MLLTEVGPDTLNKELNRYLSTTRLSLSQVAKRLGVSKGHLSEIKNGKAQPALNTGLRILKMCGLEIDQRKAWAHFYNTSISEEYLEVHSDHDKINSKKLNEKVSFLLARNSDLMNAYVDIVNEEENGIALVDLRHEYGKPIEKKLQKLVDQSVLSLEITDLGKVYRAGIVDPIITKNSSYDLVKSIVEEQQIMYQSGEDKGSFKFHINDVDEAGFEKLTALLNETMKEAEKIMLENKKNRREGGERFVFEVLLGKLRSFVIFALLSFAALQGVSETTYAQGGGLSGGNSREEVLKIIQRMPWLDILEDKEVQVSWPEVYMSGSYVKVNELCHYPSEEVIRTSEPIKVCTHTKLTSWMCRIDPHSLEQDCNQLMEGDVIPDGPASIVGHLVTKRTCVNEEYKNQEINLNKSGVFVRFNDARGDTTRTTVLPDLGEEGVFNFDIDIYVKRHSLYGDYMEKVGSKNYQMPLCI